MPSFRWKATVTAWGAAVLSVCAVPCSAAGDHALWGRSFRLHWTDRMHFVSTAGKRAFVPRDRAREREIDLYVSERGRVFAKLPNRLQGPEEGDQERPDSVTRDPWHWSVSGNAIVGTRRFIIGAQQARVTVGGPGETSCSLTLVRGTPPSSEDTMLRQGRHRHTVVVISEEVENPTCEISQGNIFSQ